jgi:hypothetical protein
MRPSVSVEGVWVNMKNGLGNLAAGNGDQLAAVVRNRLKRIQYQPALINGFLNQSGLTDDHPCITRSERYHSSQTWPPRAPIRRPSA